MTTIRKHRGLLAQANQLVRSLEEGRSVESSVVAKVISSLIEALVYAFEVIEEASEAEMDASSRADRAHSKCLTKMFDLAHSQCMDIALEFGRKHGISEAELTDFRRDWVYKEPPPSDDERCHQMARMGGQGLPL